MAEYWYHVQGSAPVGPVAAEELKGLLRSTPSWREILVWRAGFENWKKAPEVEELTPKPPPLPPEAESPSRPSNVQPRDNRADQKPQKWTLKRVFMGLVSFVVIVLAATIGKEIGKVGYQAASRSLQSPQDVQTMLAEGFLKAKQELDKQLPKKVDEITTLTGVRAEGATLVYVNRVDVDAVDVDIPAGFKALAVEVHKKNCANKNMATTMTFGGIFKYEYYDKNGKYLSTITTTKSDCGQ
jgi:hypothetical protein